MLASSALLHVVERLLRRQVLKAVVQIVPIVVQRASLPRHIEQGRSPDDALHNTPAKDE